jgi:hypothetical protein
LLLFFLQRRMFSPPRLTVSIRSLMFWECYAINKIICRLLGVFVFIGHDISARVINVWIRGCRVVNLQISQFCVISISMASEKIEFREILCWISEFPPSLPQMNGRDRWVTTPIKCSPTHGTAQYWEAIPRCHWDDVIWIKLRESPYAKTDCKSDIGCKLNIQKGPEARQWILR